MIPTKDHQAKRRIFIINQYLHNSFRPLMQIEFHTFLIKAFT